MLTLDKPTDSTVTERAPTSTPATTPVTAPGRPTATDRPPAAVPGTQRADTEPAAAPWDPRDVQWGFDPVVYRWLPLAVPLIAVTLACTAAMALYFA